MTEDAFALHILIIPEIIPFPPDDGGKLCIYGLIDYLRKFHQIHMLLSANNAYEKSSIQNLILHWPDVTIHCVELYDDFIEKKVNTNDKITGFLKKVVKGTYKALAKIKKLERPEHRNNDYDDYSFFRTTPFYPHPAPFVKKLINILAENKFDIIQTELVRVLNLIHIFPVTAKKIFVQIEGRGEVLYDYGVSNHLDLDYVKYVAANTEFLEFAYMNKYDAILALNDHDKIKIEQKVSPAVKVYTSPYGVLDANLKQLDVDDYKAENLIFIGSESHYPNFDALNWFLTDIIGEFDERPFKKLYITGNWTLPTIEKFNHLCNCVDFIGFVDDLAPYLKNSVSIVPVRIGGGGIRTKILSSMIHGSPVVATSLSVVGITGNNKKELLIADTAADFAKSVAFYFNNDQFAKEITKNAYHLIVKNYSQSIVGEIRNRIYKEICNLS